MTKPTKKPISVLPEMGFGESILEISLKTLVCQQIIEQFLFLDSSSAITLTVGVEDSNNFITELTVRMYLSSASLSIHFIIISASRDLQDFAHC